VGARDYLRDKNLARLAGITSQFYGHFSNRPNHKNIHSLTFCIFLNFTLTSAQEAVYKRPSTILMEKLNFTYNRPRKQQKQHLYLKKQLKYTGALCALTFCLPQLATTSHAQESLVQKELTRRINNAHKANELLQLGDTAYNKRDYKNAVDLYNQAFSLLPEGSVSNELRTAAAERYAMAATERARKLAKGGHYNEAKNLLDQVLKPGIAPAHLAAIKLRAQVDDPIRYNPALTPEHTQDVQKVGMTLRKADAFYSLGQYDNALKNYEEVLRIDPFNKAARRGMEKIEATKSDYFRAAYDQTRATMLAEVDQAWELPVPHEINAALLNRSIYGEESGPTLKEKLAGITIDSVTLEDASLDEALDYIRIQSRKGDAPSATGERNGINIVLTLGDPDSKTTEAINSARINLKLRDLPLSKVLDYITEQTHTQWRSDGAAIHVTPLGSSSDILISRSFSVPPNFLSAAASQTSESSDDVFDSNSSNSTGLLPEKISITDFLKQSGIDFPDGATASYNASSNRLIVRNTATNIDHIESLVSMISDEEPVQVIIRTTIRRVSEKKLKALSFDWLISPAHLGGGTFLGGGTVGTGTPLADMPLNPFSGLGAPITAGNRSGSTGLHADSLESFIRAGNTGFGSTDVRAPGILTLTGVYSGIQLQMMMRGMDQKTGADIMSQPSTIARSGERAKIEVIREMIYPTEYEPPELPTSVGQDPFNNNLLDPTLGSPAPPISPTTPAHPTAFETRNVGVTLEVEPRVGPNKKMIEVSINPELVEFEGFVNYGTPITTGSTDLLGRHTRTPITPNSILMPVFKTTRLKNQTITIQDGATIVLGGLMTSSKNKIEDKVPILGDIPLVGRLFRSETEQNINTAVIITIQAELVDPSGHKWNR